MRSLLMALGAAILAWLGCSQAERPLRNQRLPGSGGAVAAGIVSAAPSSGAGAQVEEDLIEDPDAPCDTGLDVGSDDAYEAAAAVGLCKRALGDDWGLIEARFTMADGSEANGDDDYPLGHGILARFGDRIGPREGERLLALSSGSARAPGDPGFVSPEGFDKEYVSAAPDGFPKEAPSCPEVVTGATHDDIALEVVLRAPPGAHSFAFDFDFFTFEWPVYVCSEFNDYFVALLDPAPADQPDGNVSFDPLGNPVSVNNAYVRVCSCPSGPPCLAPPDDPHIEYACESGDAELDGSGFEGHAATGWLSTLAPVAAGEVVILRWGVYDSGDGLLDSTTVIDAFRWLGNAVEDPSTYPYE
jgi:hypothetical protein